MTQTYFIRTFGCQMNELDSQKIGLLLENLGWRPAAKLDQASLILFNTCTIREKAHQKAFSEIGLAVSIKRAIRSPHDLTAGRADVRHPFIAVCGCVAQEVGNALINRFPDVDLVFGPDQIHELPKLLRLREELGRPVVATQPVNDPENYVFLDAVPATRVSGPTAFVTIMKGCNSHCGYCIVPQVRGREVYRPVSEILREIHALTERGCKEVTLLGQNVNSYRQNFGNGKIHFAKLIRLISENTDVCRIRFTSPHPKDVRPDLIEEYALNSRLCPHIHLPVQSGSDEVLKRMRRAYSRRLYLEKVHSLRQARPEIAFTTDIIVGFPGETEGDFEETLSLVHAVRYDNIFAFNYSPRPGTEAMRWRDDVPPAGKQVRLAKLLETERQISKGINQSQVGSTQEVLAEGEDKMHSGKYSGRSPTNRIVNFTSQESVIGHIVKVRITEAKGHSLEGEQC